MHFAMYMKLHRQYKQLLKNGEGGLSLLLYDIVRG